jgi:signal transduction histidine kinase
MVSIPSLADVRRAVGSLFTPTRVPAVSTPTEGGHGAFVALGGIAIALLTLTTWHAYTQTVPDLVGARDVGSLPLVLETFEMLILLATPVWLLYATRRLAALALTGTERWLVVRWTALGTVTIPVFAGVVLTKGVVLGLDIDPTPALEVLLLGATLGSIGGFLTGWYNASASRRTRQLTARRDALEFTNKLLRHHVLNGVNVIDGYADVLESTADADEREHLATIRNQSARIATLVEHVGVVGRALGDSEALEPVDLSATLEARLDVARTEHPHADIRSTLPPDLFVRGTDHLGTVFDNLLDNAVEHNDADTPQVTVTATNDNGYVHVRVEDNGPGIPEHMRDSLFRPRETGDAGFGLYLVDTMVSSYGGFVHVPDPGPPGFAIVVSLPVVDPPAGSSA